MSLSGFSDSRNSICATTGWPSTSLTGPTRKIDALLQQARVDVVRALAASALLDHHRDQAQTLSVRPSSPSSIACRVVVRIAGGRAIGGRRAGEFVDGGATPRTRTTCAAATCRAATGAASAGGNAAPVSSPAASHQVGERRRLVLDLGAAEHPVDDVAFDGERLELVQPLGLLVVPAHDGLGLLVGLRGFLHQRLHLLGLRLQAVRRGRARPATRPSATRSSALARNMSGVSLMSSAFIPCCLQVRGHALRHALRLDARPATSAARTRPSARSAASACSLTLRLDLALELEPQVGRDLGSRSSTLPLATPKASRELGVDLGQLRRRRPTSPSASNSRRLPGDFLAVVVGREGQRKRLASSPARTPVSAASNSGSIRPSPSMIGEVLRLPARELDAVDRAR